MLIFDSLTLHNIILFFLFWSIKALSELKEEYNVPLGYTESLAYSQILVMTVNV